jgi:hypothetical protein
MSITTMGAVCPRGVTLPRPEGGRRQPRAA